MFRNMDISELTFPAVVQYLTSEGLYQFQGQQQKGNNSESDSIDPETFGLAKKKRRDAEKKELKE